MNEPAPEQIDQNPVREILVTGMTSLRLKAMESDNLGNFIIIEPMFRSLRARFPDASISTTLQLSEAFADRHGLKILKSKRFYEYTTFNGLKSLIDLLPCLLWRLLHAFGNDAGSLLSVSDRLKAYDRSDFIIDFSGDLFGDNALNKPHFLTGILAPIQAKLLKKKIYFVASSPGPFKKLVTLMMAKFAFRFFDLVSVRDPISLQILTGIGCLGSKYSCHPCFSYGFDPLGALEEDELLTREPALQTGDQPIVGMIITNLNMDAEPPDKWPREDDEYAAFIGLIRHMVTEKQVRVCLFSHRHKLDADGNLFPGSDDCLVQRILELLPPDIAPSVFTVEGHYDAPTMNRIISRFHMLMSGRIHGAVQGIMQYIPTLVIDYGMEPKAHKLRGFAQLAGLLDYVADPGDADDLKQKADLMWERRERISRELQERVPKLVIESQRIWDVINDDYQAVS